MTKTILHIGMPKTGSTSMQVAFANSGKIHSIGRFGHLGLHFADEVAHELLWSGICYPSNFWERKKERYKAHIDEHREFAQTQGKNLLVSQECFTVPYPTKVDQAEVMRRLQYLFGEEAIPLVLIRDQLAWMKSFYSTFIIDFSSSLSFNDFFEKNLNPLNPVSVLDSLDYLALYKTLTGLFKEVKMMPFELVFNKNEAEPEHRWLAEELGLTKEKLTSSVHNQSRDEEHLLYARAYNEHFKVGVCNSVENQIPHLCSSESKNLLLKAQDKEAHEWSPHDLKTAEALMNRRRHGGLNYSDPKILKFLCDTVSIKPKEPEEYPTETHKQIMEVLFGPGNQELSKKLGYNLEERGYVMPPS